MKLGKLLIGEKERPGGHGPGPSCRSHGHVPNELRINNCSARLAWCNLPGQTQLDLRAIRTDQLEWCDVECEGSYARLELHGDGRLHGVVVEGENNSCAEARMADT